LYFLRGIPAGAGPTGMRYLALAANIFAANGTVNLANVTNDLGKMELSLMNANVLMTRAAWIMSPRSLIFLADLRDGNGHLAYPSLTMGAVPMLRNKRVFTTTQIPSNLGSGDKSEVILADAQHLIIGDAPRIAMDASNTAAYSDGGTIKAAFSGRKTLTRLVMENDFNTLHAGAISVLTDVAWGA
jgi:HK97 family phage major capsid protein